MRKTRNDADSGRIAAREMRCDGIGWSNDVETDYGRVHIFMTKRFLGLIHSEFCVVGRRF